MTLEGFLTFRQMVTPSVLIAVYYLGALVMPAAAWWMAGTIRNRLLPDASEESGGSRRKRKRGWRVRLLFVIFFLMGELAWRIFIEFFVAYFQMRDALIG